MFTSRSLKAAGECGQYLRLNKWTPNHTREVDRLQEAIILIVVFLVTESRVGGRVEAVVWSHHVLGLGRLDLQLLRQGESEDLEASHTIQFISSASLSFLAFFLCWALSSFSWSFLFTNEKEKEKEKKERSESAWR